MKIYKKLVLYYFTGTGNALKAGRWICEEGEKRNIKTSIYPIDNNFKVELDKIDSNTLVGFLSPTHGFSIAPAMLRFIFKFPAWGKSSVFILNTRAGLKFNRFFIPGISGAAQFLPMMILKLKGYNIVGGLPLDMPSNWLFLHSGLSRAKVDSIVQRCESITRVFINNIINGKKVFRKVLITLPVDISLLPIAFMYYIYGRFIFAKTMIYTSNCNNCKICAENCPVNAIRIVANRPYWTYSCEGCMRCINYCPLTSIETSHLIFIMILVVPAYIYNNVLFKFIHLPQSINYGFILSGLKMAVTLFELFILYAVVQRFLKLKYISHIFKYTSLSSYWRRYRAPGITLKDFRKDSGSGKLS